MPTTISASPGELPAGYKLLFHRLEKLLSSGEHSDLKITCHGTSWDVHKAIVCPASGFFHSCCKKFKEAASGVIDLPDDTSPAVHALINYIYTADYDDEFAQSDIAPILHNIHVHTIGDKYNVPDLCKLAEAKFEEHARTEWYSAGFAEAVEEMYATSPSTKEVLQDCAVGVAVEHAKALFESDTSQFCDVARRTAPFAYAVSSKLVMVQLSKREGEMRYKCRKCSESFVRETIKTIKCCNLSLNPKSSCPYGCGLLRPSEVEIVADFN